MPIFILTVILDVALVVHIVRSGRSTTWIWIIVMLPMAGALAYLIVEILPELGSTRTGRKMKRNLGKALNPDKEIKEALENYSTSESVENSMRLAEECLKRNMFDEASKLYEKCLQGIHEYDPYIMFGKAKAEFGLNHFHRVKDILDELIQHNPDFKNADAHLLYARTAAELGDIPLARQEYEVLEGYYPGPEASYRYAMLLKTEGDMVRAKTILEKIISKSKSLGHHYNELHKDWIRLAKKEYNLI